MCSKMTEVHHVLNRLTEREIKTASNYTTRSTIKLRVLMKVAKILELTLDEIYETKNLLRVDLSVSYFIEKLWKSFYNNTRGGKKSYQLQSINNAFSKNNNSVPSSDEWGTLERFLAKDFVRPIDLTRLTSVLIKRFPKKDLNFIFGVDGLYFQNTVVDYKHYFENLSVPIDDIKTNEEEEEKIKKKCGDEEPIGWAHVKAIRSIYKQIDGVSPDKIRKSLKKIFPFIEEEKNNLSSTINSNVIPFIEEEKNNSSSTIISNVSSTVNTNISRGKRIYEDISSASDTESPNSGGKRMYASDGKSENPGGKRIYEDISSGSDTETPNSGGKRIYASDSKSPGKRIYEDLSSHSDSESAKSESESDDDNSEFNIENLYRKYVGSKLTDIVTWKKMEVEQVTTKKSGRKRKSDDSECRRPGRPSRKSKKDEE